MSRLSFDGATHILSLLTDNGSLINSWSAYNNVDSHATLRHVNNGIYQIQDRSAPHPHTANPNGPYGSYGIIRFNVPGHPGIGVHSGRANARHLPGPAHPTMGCVRTTDEAMRTLKEHMASHPLSTIEILNNSGPSAVGSTQRNENRVYQGVRMEFI
ncbi:TPA: L,D-transpeptidase family protein [Citrobacter gillenii]